MLTIESHKLEKKATIHLSEVDESCLGAYAVVVHAHNAHLCLHCFSFVASMTPLPGTRGWCDYLCDSVLPLYMEDKYADCPGLKTEPVESVRRANHYITKALNI